MELYQTENHYVLLDGDFSLWCSRSDGSIKAGTGELPSSWNGECLGIVYGLVGKVKVHADSEWKLILIKNQTNVGQIAEVHDIYQINKVVILSLSAQEPVDLALELCPKHSFVDKQGMPSSTGQSSKPLQKTWNSVKSAVENVKPKKKEVKDKEKFERRINEELLKLFNESNSFYYSHTLDLTNTIQRQYTCDIETVEPLWKRADERFFWNKHLLKELLDSGNDLSSHWIVPIIQGFVENNLCLMEFDENLSLTPTGAMMMANINRFNKDPLKYWLTIISRRSRHRAGTRSKKRGLDEKGSCANYVETEQIIQFPPHLVSFVQVRGSVPVFWSQSGFKYRPPPKLERDELENKKAFDEHFAEQLSIYDQVSVITLVELIGKERVIGNAYLDHILDYNSNKITYITFDFHEYCRGMKFENVSILTDCIKDIIKDMRYCWVDSKGIICDQKGVFRVNCVDCLDRTNVVQTAIARIVMETQCRKLGLLPPDETLPRSCRVAFQQIWANNGDAISQQYAGTAALKGDFTRTGERKFSGMMKDGVNSANRYYLRFRDDYRQAAMDVLLGQPIAEETLLSAGLQEDEVEGELLEKEENVRMLIDDLKKMLIVEPEQCLGGWSLVNADPVSGDHDRQEMDTILLLSQRAFYVGWYDDEKEQVTQYQQVYLEDIEKIEIGLEPSIFKSKYTCMRIHYHHFADEGFFHTFRAPSTRLFNNVVVLVKNEEEAKESLKAVCHCFMAAKNIVALDFEIVEKPKLDRTKTKPHPSVINISKQLQETSLAAITLPRNISVSDLNAETKEFEKANTTPERQTISGLFDIHRNPFSSKNGGEGKSKDYLLNKISLPLKGTTLQLPKLSLQNLNPMKNVNLGGLRLPTVFYSPLGSKENDDEGSVHVQPATTLSHEDAHSDTEASQLSTMASASANTPPSTKEAETVASATLLDMTQDQNSDVMFRSCGILATNPKQLLVSSLSLSSDVDPDEFGPEVTNVHMENDAAQGEGSLDDSNKESSVMNKLRRQFSRTETVDQSPVTNAESTKDENTEEVDGFGISSSVDTGEIEKDPDNPEGPRRPRKPLPLKPSFSDGAICSHAEITNRSKPTLMLENNPLTKLGMKIQSGMRAIPSPVRASNKETVDLLKEQVMDKMQGRECHTRIIFI